MVSFTVTKRHQARLDRALQSLREVPGNNVCADCGAREPSWASYSLGIFLCVRCATCHRALGSHISKVKSVSMDVWTNDQIEAIKAVGNIASNRIYNPRNIRPTIPADPDMTDSAMEQYIRDKYQRRSFGPGGQALRNHTGSTTSTDDIPPPPPPKPVGFGLGARSVSATFPLSRREQPLPQLPIGEGRQSSSQSTAMGTPAIQTQGWGPPQTMSAPQTAYPSASLQAQTTSQLNSFNPFLASEPPRPVQSFPIDQQMQSMHISQPPPQPVNNWYDTPQETNPYQTTLTPPISPPPFQSFPLPGPASQVSHSSQPGTPSMNTGSSNPFLRMTRNQTFPTNEISFARQPSPALSSTAYDQFGQQVNNTYLSSQPPTIQTAWYQQPQHPISQENQNPFPYQNPIPPHLYQQPVTTANAGDIWMSTGTSQPYQPYFADGAQVQQQSPARIDKDSILALFGQSSVGQTASAAPNPNQTNPEHSSVNQPTRPQQRSVTMPVSTQEIAQASTRKPNLNPFAAMANAPTAQTPATYAHVRKESEEFSGSLMANGRHSPDAFANLSARYI